MTLKDKVAIITGASSGIGKAISKRFADEGAKVAFNYRLGGKLNPQTAEQQAKQFGSNVTAVAGDISQRPDVERMVQEVVARFGRLDIVVSNAGIEFNRPFLEVPDEEWHRVISVNLYGAFIVSQICARQMVKQGGGGKIIFISSVHEDIPLPDYTPYCASKGGIRMLMRNISYELAPHKINVNNIAPGFIATPINESVLKDPEATKKAQAEIPLRRFGSPDEVANVATFLASAESDYVTDSTYLIDGGLTREVPSF